MAECTEKLEGQPFFLDQLKLWNSVQFLVQVVADKLSDTHQRLLAQVEYLFVSQDVGVFVQGVGAFDFVDIILKNLELFAFYLLEMKFADNRAFIFNRAQNSLVKLRVI